MGRIGFGAAFALQQKLAEERKRGSIPDQLLLVEHPHVVTMGRNGRAGNLLASEELMMRAGIGFHHTNRGGDVTYHGPGQIVGYPIIDLRPDRCDVHRYVRDLEEAMIRVCADYGVAAGRIEGLSGAWVGPGKIGAVGVRISRWITSHGFAFNVSTSLRDFQLIVPCGIADRGVTSLEKETGRALSIDDVEERIIHRFAQVFER